MLQVVTNIGRVSEVADFVEQKELVLHYCPNDLRNARIYYKYLVQ